VIAFGTNILPRLSKIEEFVPPDQKKEAYSYMKSFVNFNSKTGVLIDVDGGDGSVQRFIHPFRAVELSKSAGFPVGKREDWGYLHKDTDTDDSDGGGGTGVSGSGGNKKPASIISCSQGISFNALFGDGGNDDEDGAGENLEDTQIEDEDKPSEEGDHDEEEREDDDDGDEYLRTRLLMLSAPNVPRNSPSSTSSQKRVASEPAVESPRDKMRRINPFPQLGGCEIPRPDSVLSPMRQQVNTTFLASFFFKGGALCIIGRVVLEEGYYGNADVVF